ncbi:hypothetical protein LAZ40_09885 [Cereibacter sphaeroides]|uniref:hypothetical protein n=1 Tax=Cereibacter sphaeroides TaxID=1063 RepID=UPI001F45C544|nr:hypothetical protein [Cereibacter sphaeroides]MCE6959361.1 hypothetical protein [Cereibacter sphaeroides]MCE6972953.1 hypothetical protein [Cereibacter sphaeroides]
MTEREVRKETGVLGGEREFIYENGRKIGEVRTEDRGGFLGIARTPTQVERTLSGEEMSTITRESRGGFLGIGARDVEVRRAAGREVGVSAVEECGGFFGFGAHHERVERDSNEKVISTTTWQRRGGVLGIGSRRVRVTQFVDGRQTAEVDPAPAGVAAASRP